MNLPRDFGRHYACLVSYEVTWFPPVLYTWPNADKGTFRHLQKISRLISPVQFIKINWVSLTWSGHAYRLCFTLIRHYFEKNSAHHVMETLASKNSRSTSEFSNLLNITFVVMKTTSKASRSSTELIYWISRLSAVNDLS